MNVAPGSRVVDVQVPRGADWNTPLSPLAEQEALTIPSPAPMSDETTATWMLGNPPGRSLRTFMKVGTFLSRFACDRFIDAELSIMKRTSRLRFEITALVSVCGRSASV